MPSPNTELTDPSRNPCCFNRCLRESWIIWSGRVCSKSPREQRSLHLFRCGRKRFNKLKCGAFVFPLVLEAEVHLIWGGMPPFPPTQNSSSPYCRRLPANSHLHSCTPPPLFSYISVDTNSTQFRCRLFVCICMHTFPVLFSGHNNKTTRSDNACTCIPIPSPFVSSLAPPSFLRASLSKCR